MKCVLRVSRGAEDQNQKLAFGTKSYRRCVAFEIPETIQAVKKKNSERFCNLVSNLYSSIEQLCQ